MTAKTFQELKQELSIEWMNENIDLYIEALEEASIGDDTWGYSVNHYENDKFEIIHAGLVDNGFVNGHPEANADNLKVQFWLAVRLLASTTLNLYPFLHHHDPPSKRKKNDIKWAKIIKAYLNGELDDLPDTYIL